MSLIITDNKKILGDVPVSSLYVRVTGSYGPNGDSVDVKSNAYSSKAAYKADQRRNTFFMEGIPYNISCPYVRDVDGVDIMGVIHVKLKEYLSTDITAERQATDPSTGLPAFDPSTGEAIMETYVTRPKFTDVSNIEFDF